jgi:hypothetical protein
MRVHSHHTKHNTPHNAMQNNTTYVNTTHGVRARRPRFTDVTSVGRRGKHYVPSPTAAPAAAPTSAATATATATKPREMQHSSVNQRARGIHSRQLTPRAVGRVQPHDHGRWPHGRREEERPQVGAEWEGH